MSIYQSDDYSLLQINKKKLHRFIFTLNSHILYTYIHIHTHKHTHAHTLAKIYQRMGSNAFTHAKPTQCSCKNMSKNIRVYNFMRVYTSTLTQDTYTHIYTHVKVKWKKLKINQR